MSKVNLTKKAFVLSILSLVICLSMFVGTTLAWFTDVATTGENKIVAGNLDVELEYSTDLATWNAVENDTKLFKEDTLWEPGHTQIAYLRIRNAGTLALDYTLNVFAANEQSGTSVLGNEFWLSEGLKFGLSVTNDAPAALLSREEARELTSTSNYQLNKESDKEQLLAGQSKYVTLAVYMPLETGNEYNYKTGTVEPFIDLRILVEATQSMSEEDHFGNNYDENADGTPDHPEFAIVNNPAQLKEAMDQAQAGDVIVLNSGKYEFTESIKTDGTLKVAADSNVTLHLNGESITTNASSSSDEVKVNEPTVYNEGNLTIEGGTIVNKNATAGNTNVAAVHNVSGELTLKNCTIENVAPTSGGNYCVTVEGGSVTLIDCTVKGNRGGIYVSGDGEIHMIGGSVSATIYYPLAISGNGNSTFDGVKFTKQSSSKGKAVIYNALETGTGTVKFTNCEFVSNISSETKLDIYGNFTGLTFDNCTYTNVKKPE